MPELQKKISIRPLFHGAILLCLLVTLGCTKTQVPKKKLLIAPPNTPAGAIRWDNRARLLPQGSPMVISVRPSDLLVRMDQLYEWFIEQPAMFKTNGEQTVQGLANVRKAIGNYWSFDPLSTKGWQSLGLDIKQPIYMGLYPLAKNDKKILRSTNQLIEQQIGDPSQPGFLKKLKAQPKDKSISLYKDLAALTRQSEHVTGARILLPILDQIKLVERLDIQAKRLGFIAVKPNKTVKITRIYHNNKVGEPIIVLRQTKTTLIIDLLMAGIPNPKNIPLEPLVFKTINQVPSGLPDAPRPFDRPILSMAINQRGFADYLKFHTWLAVQKKASLKGATERDGVVVDDIKDRHKNLLAWSTQVPGTSGVTYDLLAGDLNQIVQLRMNNFGVRQLTPPPKPAPTPSLNISQRGIGLSLNPDLFFGKQWKAWLGMDAPYHLEQLFMGQNKAQKAFAFALAAPINASLLISNLPDIIRLNAPLDFVPIYNQRKSIKRLEISTFGSLSGFVIKPKFLCLFALDPKLDKTDRDAVSASITDTLKQAASRMAKTKGKTTLPSGTALTPGLNRYKVPADHHMAPFQYYYQRDGKNPLVLMGYNMNAGEMQAQFKALQTRPEFTAHMRLEPSSLIQLFSTYSMAEFADIDLNVLAQRLGPLTMKIDPKTSQGVSTIEYTITLQKPPQIKK